MKSTAAVAPAMISYGSVPNSNRSGTTFVEGRSLSGFQGFEQRRIGGQGCAVRPEEFVGGAGEEVCAQCGDVDRCVGGVVHPVHVYECSDLVCPSCDLVDGRLGAQQVGGCGDRDQPGALTYHLVEFVETKFRSSRVEAEPTNGDAYSGGGLDPGTDIGVVVELGDDDLVAGRPSLGQVTTEVVGDLRGATTVDDPGGRGAEQVGQCGAESADRVLGVLFAGDSDAAIGKWPGERSGDRCPNDGRRLGATRAVEVGDAGGQRRKLRTSSGDVEWHGAPSIKVIRVQHHWSSAHDRDHAAKTSARTTRTGS